MTDDDQTAADLRERVDKLESQLSEQEAQLKEQQETIRAMLPSRRDLLKAAGGGAAGVGLGALLTGSASAGNQSVGTIGTQSSPIDVFAEDIYDHNGNNPMSFPGDGSVNIGSLSDKSSGNTYDVDELNQSISYSSPSDESANRSIDTQYTNNTGDPLKVYVGTEENGSGSVAAIGIVDGTTVTINSDDSGTNDRAGVSFTVPAGSTYKVDDFGYGNAIYSWAEQTISLS